MRALDVQSLGYMTFFITSNAPVNKTFKGMLHLARENGLICVPLWPSPGRKRIMADRLAAEVFEGFASKTGIDVQSKDSSKSDVQYVESQKFLGVLRSRQIKDTILKLKVCVVV